MPNVAEVGRHVGIRLADAYEGASGQYDAENMAALADSLRSFCP